MPDVGVRELKQHLSQYLDRAQRGELITVTDRGHPKALLGPLPGRARVDAGISEGWITPGSSATLRPAPRASSERRVIDALAEDREQ